MTPRRRRQPRRADIIAKRVLEIRYIHIEDGQPYRHEFAPGVLCEVLPDGSARLYRPDGKPVWKNFL
jgi:hypothetical protein